MRSPDVFFKPLGLGPKVSFQSLPLTRLPVQLPPPAPAASRRIDWIEQIVRRASRAGIGRRRSTHPGGDDDDRADPGSWSARVARCRGQRGLAGRRIGPTTRCTT